MRSIAIAAVSTLLVACTTPHDMSHGAMSHEEMMRHCQMMEQSPAQGAYDPAQHGGMSQEEMARHCAAMREGHGGAEQPRSPQAH